MSLRSGASHRLRVIIPDCQISNYHFFQAWELFHDITHFLKQHLFLPLFPIVLVTNLITLITCQHLPNLISGYCQKFLSQNFNFTLRSNYIWQLNFLFNPSCTTPQTNIVTLRVWVNLWAILMKRYSTFPKAPVLLEPWHRIV